MGVFWFISSLTEFARVVYLLLLVPFYFFSNSEWHNNLYLYVILLHHPFHPKVRVFFSPHLLLTVPLCGSSTSYFLFFLFHLIETSILTKKQDLTIKTNQPNLLFCEALGNFSFCCFFFFNIILEGGMDHYVSLSNTFGLLDWNQFRTAWWERERPMGNMSTICMWPWAIIVIYFSLLTSVCCFSWALLTLLAGFLKEWILLVCSYARCSFVHICLQVQLIIKCLNMKVL